jgi:hypothetical protein
MRLQLRRAGRLVSSLAALALLAPFGEHVARADEPDARAPPPSSSTLTTRGFTEIGGYQDSVAVSVLTPSVGASVEDPTSGWGIDGRYLVDFVTAASPDIVATASPRWSEVRHAGNLGARYKPGTFGVAVSGSASTTPDYLALSGRALLTQELDDKNLTLTAGYGYGHDTIGRTGTPFSVYSHGLAYHTISAGVTRLLGPSAVLGISSDVILEDGDQSKPYRYVPMFEPGVASTIARGASVSDVAGLRIQARPLEHLPTSRQRAALSTRLAWRLDGATLRLDERLYADTWALAASTTDARVLFDVTSRWTLWPHVRFHVQSGVSFWQRAYAALDAEHLPSLRTGDRELSPLANSGLGGGARVALGRPGALQDYALTFTVDGTWTSFFDAMYVKDRLAGISVLGLEVTF